MQRLSLDGGQILSDYLGRTLDSQEQRTASIHLQQAADMAHEHTRGAGFDPLQPDSIADSLMGIIVARAARTMSNPTDMSSWSASGISQRPGRTSWTLAELRTLDSFRVQSSSFKFMDD